jgi:hypothetical protein
MAIKSDSNQENDYPDAHYDYWFVPLSRRQWQTPLNRRTVRWRGSHVILPAADHRLPESLPREKIEQYPRSATGLYSCWALIIVVFACSMIFLALAFL